MMKERKKAIFFSIAILLCIFSVAFIVQKSTFNNKTAKLQDSEDLYSSKAELENLYKQEYSNQNEKRYPITVIDNGTEVFNKENFIVDGYFLDSNGQKVSGIYQNITRNGENSVTFHVDMNLKESNMKITDASVGMNGNNVNYKINKISAPSGSETGDSYARISELISGTTYGFEFELTPDSYYTCPEDNGWSYIIIKGKYSLTNNDKTYPGEFNTKIKFRVDWDSDRSISELNIKNNAGSSLIQTKDGLVLSLKVDILNDNEGCAIPRKSEFIVNGLKIGTYAPDKVEVESNVYSKEIEEVNYDKSTGIVKFKSNAKSDLDPNYNAFSGGGAHNLDASANITITYSTNIDQIKAIIENGYTMNMVGYARLLNNRNPNITYSAPTEYEPFEEVTQLDIGTSYSNVKTNTCDIYLKDYNGKVVSLKHKIGSPPKYISMVYYNTDKSEVKQKTKTAQFREDYIVGVFLPGTRLKLEKADYQDSTGTSTENFLYSTENTQYQSMKDFVTYTGVRLGADVKERLTEGGITLYDEKGNVITVQKDGLGDSITTILEGGAYKFKNPVKKVTCKTSEIKSAGEMTLYLHGEVDNEKLMSTVSTFDTFNQFNRIRSAAKASVSTDNGVTYLDEGNYQKAEVEYVTGNFQSSVKEVSVYKYFEDKINYKFRWDSNIVNDKAPIWNPTIKITFPETIEKASYQNKDVEVYTGSR